MAGDRLVPIAQSICQSHFRQFIRVVFYLFVLQPLFIQGRIGKNINFVESDGTHC